MTIINKAKIVLSINLSAGVSAIFGTAFQSFALFFIRYPTVIAEPAHTKSNNKNTISQVSISKSPIKNSAKISLDKLTPFIIQ